MNNVITDAEKRCRAFSLVELLTVIALMSLLVSVAVPALTSLAKGSQMNQSLIELSGTLDAARQYAISRNTYVWVALRHNTEGSAGDELSMVTVASKSGTDPSAWSHYGQVPNAQLDIVGQPRTFSQIRLEEAGFFDSSRIPSLSGKSEVNSGNSLADGTAVFQVKLPGKASPVDFSRVIQFTPAGEARVSSSVIDVVEIGVHPTRGDVADENNIAVLRVNGLTGQTSVYRR